MVYYNIWLVERNRWVLLTLPIEDGHATNQDERRPKPLTYEEAKRMKEYFSFQETFTWEIRKLPKCLIKKWNNR
jgi:hypothetical protein